MGANDELRRFGLQRDSSSSHPILGSKEIRRPVCPALFNLAILSGAVTCQVLGLAAMQLLLKFNLSAENRREENNVVGWGDAPMKGSVPCHSK